MPPAFIACSRLRSADRGDLVIPRMLSRFGCRSFRVSGPTIWNDLPVDIRSTDITREQFKRSLKIWLFECAYGRRRVWETVQPEGVPKKWTYLHTYLLIRTRASEPRPSIRDGHYSRPGVYTNTGLKPRHLLLVTILHILYLNIYYFVIVD